MVISNKQLTQSKVTMKIKRQTKSFFYVDLKTLLCLKLLPQSKVTMKMKMTNQIILLC
jgi:hypothetical protein